MSSLAEKEKIIEEIKNTISNNDAENEDIIDLTDIVYEEEKHSEKKERVKLNNTLDQIKNNLEKINDEKQQIKAEDSIKSNINKESYLDEGISIKSLAIEIASPRIKRWIEENLSDVIQKEVETAISKVIKEQNLPEIIKREIQATINRIVKN